MNRLMSARFLFAVITLCFGGAKISRADALSELADFSVFDKINLEQLAKGKPTAVRDAPMGSPRFLSVQVCWAVPGTPAQEIDALRHWDPSSHPALNIFMHVNGPDFSRLSDAPRNSAVKAFVKATEKLSSKLQISREEAARFPGGVSPNESNMPPAVATFWSDLLGARYRAFATGGTAAQPSYDHTGEPINPGEQVSRLLRDQEKIRKQFAPLLDNSGIGRGAGGKPAQYWEFLNVDKKGVLTLGANYSRPGPGGAIQAADVSYYASGGFDAALTFHQMWPVIIEGRPFTLVWRGDMISSAEVAKLRGIGRLAAEAIFKKEISHSVRLFLRDTSGNR